ncbi:MAG: inosine/xanthosine triphosphatase [Chloroflexota bacterium]
MKANRLLIAVGSSNPSKVNAVRSVIERAQLEATVHPFDAPSGVASQPIGVAEMTQGARQRAMYARTSMQADWGVGMEGGVEFDQDGSVWLFSMVVIVTKEQGESRARGGQIRLPSIVAQRLHTGAELGPLMDELVGTTDLKRGLGAIGYLTKGLITREESYCDSFSRALAPLLHPHLYTPSHLEEEDI